MRQDVKKSVILNCENKKKLLDYTTQMRCVKEVWGAYGRQNFTGRSRSLTLVGGSRQRSSCGGAALPFISILAPVMLRMPPPPAMNCMAVKPMVISSPQLLTKYLRRKTFKDIFG
jgi:hypothetical protein